MKPIIVDLFARMDFAKSAVPQSAGHGGGSQPLLCSLPRSARPVARFLELAMAEIYSFAVRTIDGTEATLEPFKNQVLLIVNVASKCGFTPQYTALEALHRKLHGRGFSVLGFPCNQFGQQEPGNEDEIRNFCSLTYDVTFPMFAKVDVNGPGAHPLFQYLKQQQPGLLGSQGIKWNFTKFLVDQHGLVRKRYGSVDKPESIEPEIEALLG
jgi:glutathione peroxidase